RSARSCRAAVCRCSPGCGGPPARRSPSPRPSRWPERAPRVRRSRGERQDPRETFAGVYIDPRENIASKQVSEWLALCTLGGSGEGGGEGEKTEMSPRFALLLSLLLFGMVIAASHP